MADINPSTLTADELRTLVATHSEEEVRTKVEQIGAEAVLDRVFAEMQERFQPARAGDTSAQVQFTIDDLAYFVRIHAGECETGRGKAQDERVGLKTSLPTFLKLITGETEGMAAFMTGKLKVRGDMMFAPQMLAYFERP